MTLEDLKLGDEVAILMGHDVTGWAKLANVDGVSMTHIRAAGRQFERATGEMALAGFLDGAFGFRAVVPTDAIRRTALTYTAREAIHDDRLNLDQLRRIAAIIEEPTL